MPYSLFILTRRSVTLTMQWYGTDIQMQTFTFPARIFLVRSLSPLRLFCVACDCDSIITK